MIRVLLIAAVALSLGVYVVAGPGHRVAQAVTPAGQRVDISPLPKATAGNNKLENVLKVVFTIMGALSLMMVTIGGVRYVTSQGDPKSTAQAKGTILYALIGLVVCILSIAIVSVVAGAL